MDYQKIYDSIINRAKQRKLDESICSEKHHIKPKCLRGSDAPSNLVKLSLREHFICHLLLVKIYPENKGLKSACWLMCNRIHNGKISSRQYEYCRQLYIESKRGKKYTTEMKHNVSEGTKAAMKDPERILKRRKGVLGTKFYYNKKTGQCFKWFKNDPDIDHSVYEWGRGRHISESQREKLMNLKNINRKLHYNKQLGLKKIIYPDNESVSENWEICHVTKNELKNYTGESKFLKLIMNDVHFELMKRQCFDFDKIAYVHIKELPKLKYLSQGFYNVCLPILLNWKNELKNKEKYIINVADFIECHLTEIDIAVKNLKI